MSGWYEIRIQEAICEKSLAWFEESTITQTTSGETLRQAPSLTSPLCTVG
jgi:hypothetical protein